MDLLSLCQTLEESGIGRLVRESVWLFAAIESVHLIGLTMMGGAALLIDLRLLNLVMADRPVAELATDAKRYFNIGLITLALSGFALFASEAVKCYYSQPFWVKIITLFVATIFTYAFRNRVALARDDSYGTGTKTLAAVGSIAMWFVVAAAGRWIGFSG